MKIVLNTSLHLTSNLVKSKLKTNNVLIVGSPVQTKKSSKCLSNTTVHEESSAETSPNKTEKCTSVVVIG